MESIGWPVDECTRTGISQLTPAAWTNRLGVDRTLIVREQVADLTGILRHRRCGHIEGWSVDLRLIVSRTPRAE